MNLTTYSHSKIVVIIAAFAVCCVGLVAAQTQRPSPEPSSSSKYGNRHLAPDSGNADSAQAPDEPAQDYDVVRLLKEQNKRLKAQVERLAKENAELRAKLAEKQ